MSVPATHAGTELHATIRRISTIAHVPPAGQETLAEMVGTEIHSLFDKEHFAVVFIFTCIFLCKFHQPIVKKWHILFPM